MDRLTLLGLGVPLLVGFVASLGATFVWQAVARRAGLVTQPREDRWHRQPIPLLGGLAIMLGLLASLLFGGGMAAFE